MIPSGFSCSFFVHWEGKEGPFILLLCLHISPKFTQKWPLDNGSSTYLKINTINAPLNLIWLIICFMLISVTFLISLFTNVVRRQIQRQRCSAVRMRDISVGRKTSAETSNFRPKPRRREYEAYSPSIVQWRPRNHMIHLQDLHESCWVNPGFLYWLK